MSVVEASTAATYAAAAPVGRVAIEDGTMAGRRGEDKASGSPHRRPAPTARPDPAAAPAGVTAAGKPWSRARGFVSVRRAATAPIAKIVSRHGFSEPNILLHWDDIVGAELAALCRPLRVRYARGRNLATRLVVAADGPVALVVEHRSADIVARINAHYGYGAISSLSVTQAAPRAPSRPADAATARRHPGRGEAAEERAPSPDAAARVAGLVCDVADSRLRDALFELGAYIMVDNSAGESPAAAPRARDREGTDT
ncbi:MAG: DciA family protein [Pseudomonadota bacterium]